LAPNSHIYTCILFKACSVQYINAPAEGEYAMVARSAQIAAVLTNMAARVKQYRKPRIYRLPSSEYDGYTTTLQ